MADSYALRAAVRELCVTVMATDEGAVIERASAVQLADQYMRLSEQYERLRADYAHTLTCITFGCSRCLDLRRDLG